MITLSEIEQPASVESLSVQNKFGAVYLCLASIALVPLLKTGLIVYFCRALTGEILKDDIYAAYLMLKTREPRAVQMAKRALNIDLLCSVLMAIISIYSIIYLDKIAAFGIVNKVKDSALYTALVLLITSIINILVWRLYLRKSKSIAVNYQYQPGYIGGTTK